jgi:hypothetical protein
MDALDRELAAALAVDPSPEFVARVRARIASEPAPSSWRMPRLVLAAGTLAVAVGLSVLVAPRPAPPIETPVVETPVVVQAFRPAVAVAPVQRIVARPEPAPIQLVSIDDLPTAPIGTVVPQMAFDVVTMTGVHP